MPRKSKPSKSDDDPPKENPSQPRERWDSKWKAFESNVDFNDDDAVLEAMKDIHRRMCLKQVPVSVVKTFAYLAQTAHKILVDKVNFEARISELEHIAGINVATRNGIKHN